MGEQNFWAISASEGTDRDYSKIFFDFGIACLGGRNPKATAKDVKENDILVLKRSCGKDNPKKEKFSIAAVGKVLEKFHEDSYFDDVEGWKLNYAAKVEWYKQGDPFPIEGLKQGTIDKILRSEPKQKAKEMLNNGEQIPKNKEERFETRTLSNDEILTFLIENGLSTSYAEDVSTAIHRVKRLAAYYNNFLDSEKRPIGIEEPSISEDETRAFLVLPLLLSLGWSEQRIRLEIKAPNRGEVDIGLYRKPHKFDPTVQPYLIIEVKRLGKGLDPAKKQAKDYFKDYPDCKRFIVTNGLFYKVYERDSEDFLASYLNITQMLNVYRYEKNVGGAKEVFKAPLPPEYGE